MGMIGSGIDALRSFITRCTSAGGVPIFKTKYGGKRLPNNAVIAACWGKGKEVPGGTITNVPEDIITEMEHRTGDWKWLSEKLGARY